MDQTNLTKKEILEQFEDYKKFAFKDDMFRLAVAFVLGTAFGKVVTAISDCLIMPLLTFIISQTGSVWKTATWSPIPGLVFEVGKFFGTMLEFVLVSVVLFLIVKFVNRMTK
jgi:large conductance mechanosensitive channel